MIARLLLFTALLTIPASAGSPPVIDSFTAAPALVNRGQVSTLSWSVTGATDVRIDPGVGPVTGTSLKVRVNGATTYTLTATNASGSQTATVTVAFGSPPAITSFAANPTKVLTGQSSTLSWTVTGATSVRVDPGPTSIAGSSLTVSPRWTTLYTLMASNAFGTSTATVLVTAGGPPVITSFAASPAKVPIGQSSTLSWVVTGATSLTVDQGVGAVTGSSTRVSPAATATYTLTAVNAFGTVTATTTVLAGTLPAVTAFTASPTKITIGQSSTLSWTATGATGLSISPDIGTVTGTSIIVSPRRTTAYTLTATNAIGTATAIVTVLAGNGPVITSFTASPPGVVTGQSSMLTWMVSGATSLAIDQGVGAVTGSAVRVTPQLTTTYTLTATNTFGSATAPVTITTGTLPVITSFTASSTKVISGQSCTLSWAVAGAASVAISPNLGVVSGTSATVRPTAATTYILTATNSIGSVTARVTVQAGTPPVVTGLMASPAKLIIGQSSTLSWTASGATSLTLDPGAIPVSGSSVKVIPSATTTYTLTATNPFGTASATTTILAGSTPSISSITATPSTVSPGQSTTIAWTVTGANFLRLDPVPGSVTGASATVSPTGATTYTLTATNSFGTATARVLVLVGLLPVISSFSTNPLMAAGPGVSAKLMWSATGAARLTIDHGVGVVTGTSVNVSPTTTTTYTLTAMSALGSVTATATVNYIPLHTVTSQLLYSEHALFLIPDPGQVDWAGANSWGSAFSTANIDSYVAALKSVFPDDFFFVVVAANHLQPNSVPNVLTYRHLADGIGLPTVQGVGVPDICRYNIGGGTVIDGSFGVLDHEIGHNWGVFIGPEVGNGHWLSNSTATGQMATLYSDDGYTTIKQISGDPVNGFTWAAVNNITLNETDTFSSHNLYLMGLNDSFPDLYVLDTPVYNPGGTLTYASATKYDQAWVEQQNGLRNPTYRTSDKRLRMGVVYVAQDMAEVRAVYQPVERSLRHFADAEQIDTTTYRFQVPFLVDTQYRASVDARLADLDGNQTPTLTLDGAANLVSADGTAVVPFTAADPDGPAPQVSCVPASANCAINGANVMLTGLASGAHFFTIKAEDAGGKKTFAHFVVDVQ